MAPYSIIIKKAQYGLHRFSSKGAIAYSITRCKYYYQLIKRFFGINVPSSTFGAFTKNVINLSAVPQFTPVGMFVHDFLFFLYQNIEKHLYGPISKDMYNNTLPV
jgi:hypothetical protein